MSHRLSVGKRDARSPGRGRDHLFLLFAIFAYLLGLIIAWLPELGGVQRLLPPGVALLVIGAVAFLRQGGSVISASAVLAYGITVFAAFPAVYAGLGLFPMRIQPTDKALVIAVSLNFLLLLLVLLICPSKPRAGPAASAEAAGPAVANPNRWSAFAILMFAIAFVAGFMGNGLIASQLGLASVLVAGGGAFWGKASSGGIGRVVVLVLIGLGYAEFIFSGFGRLVLAVIAIAVAIMATIRVRGRWVKAWMILGTAPALVYLSLSRLQFLTESRGFAPDAVEGIGSVVGPLISSGVIIDALNDGHIGPTLGATLVTAALFWVPRSIWPAKPPGFGREIVPITQPDLVVIVEHSDAGTLVGEAVWNFGVPFALLLLGAVALLVRGLDRDLPSLLAGRYSLPGALLWVTVVSSILHLVWGGFFAQMSRVGPLAFALIALTIMRALVIRGSANTVRRSAGRAFQEGPA